MRGAGARRKTRADVSGRAGALDQQCGYQNHDRNHEHPLLAAPWNAWTAPVRGCGLAPEPTYRRGSRPAGFGVALASHDDAYFPVDFHAIYEVYAPTRSGKTPLKARGRQPFSHRPRASFIEIMVPDYNNPYPGTGFATVCRGPAQLSGLITVYSVDEPRCTSSSADCLSFCAALAMLAKSSALATFL